jgi:hypothetical protein
MLFDPSLPGWFSNLLLIVLAFFLRHWIRSIELRLTRLEDLMFNSLERSRWTLTRRPNHENHSP